MTKQIIALSIIANGAPGAIAVSDADHPGVASGVLAAAQARQDLYFPVEDGMVFIPFHAIVAIEVTRTSTEVEAPVDALCQTDDGGVEPDPGN